VQRVIFISVKELVGEVGESKEGWGSFIASIDQNPTMVS
jgi:hypothetical protein